MNFLSLFLQKTHIEREERDPLSHIYLHSKKNMRIIIINYRLHHVTTVGFYKIYT
jgi:hypothetical protein